jgi:hypothetical protein
MWTQKKSVILSIVCTRVIATLSVALAVAAPFLVANGFLDNRAVIHEGAIPLLLIVGYIGLIAELVLLFTLDRLLCDIRHGSVFTRQNVVRLRVISWACFAVSILLLCTGNFISFVLILIGVAAGFFGLILRVVKNVIAAAVQIKNENDFTI